MTEYVRLSDVVALRREASVVMDNTEAYLTLYNGLQHLPVVEIDDDLPKRVEDLSREYEARARKPFEQLFPQIDWTKVPLPDVPYAPWVTSTFCTPDSIARRLRELLPKGGK